MWRKRKTETFSSLFLNWSQRIKGGISSAHEKNPPRRGLRRGGRDGRDSQTRNGVREWKSFKLEGCRRIKGQELRPAEGGSASSLSGVGVVHSSVSAANVKSCDHLRTNLFAITCKIPVHFLLS